MNEPTEFESDVLQTCADLGMSKISPEEFYYRIQACLVREEIRRQNPKGNFGLGQLGKGLNIFRPKAKRKNHLTVLNGGRDV